mgnify:CR=1 FL=1
MFQGTGACMGRRKYVLIVDDCQQDRMAVADVLRSDYDILEACNGKQALEILSRKRAQISLIMLDLMMPVMDGMEATQRIRDLKREDAASIPIIAMTAQTTADIRETCRKAGMDDYIAKPIREEELAKVIRKSWKVKKV